MPKATVGRSLMPAPERIFGALCGVRIPVEMDVVFVSCQRQVALKTMPEISAMVSIVAPISLS